MTDFRKYVKEENEGFHKLDLDKLMSDPPPPPEWLWEGFIERGELVWLAGPGKAGKSMVALALAAALQNGGGSFLGRRLMSGVTVSVIDCENSIRTVSSRLGRLSGRPLEYVLARGVDLSTREHLEMFECYCVSGNESDGPHVVILDSLIGLHRIDEDKASEVRRFVSGIRAVAEEFGTTVIGLAHENRGGNMRGSLDWRNAADTVLELRKDERGWRTLTVKDRRNGEEGDSLTFRFASGEGGRLEFVTTATPQPGRSAVDVMSEQVGELLAVNPEISQSEAARRLGVGRDSWSFRKGWAVARAVMESSPGGLGAPPIGAPAPPTTHPGGEE